jgi:hypothetical protein
MKRRIWNISDFSSGDLSNRKYIVCNSHFLQGAFSCPFLNDAAAGRRSNTNRAGWMKAEYRVSLWNVFFPM